MTSEYITIEQAAERLRLHVRTVRKYVRAGRLKAVRVGKQYLISPEDLDALIGLPATALPTGRASRGRHTEIVSLIHMDNIDAEKASILSDAVRSNGSSWHRDCKPVRVDASYDESRKRLRLILSGDIPGMSDAINTIDLLSRGSC